MTGRRVAAFDLDMTLIDSRTTILEAFGAVGDELRVPIDLRAVDRRLGLKLENELRFWVREGDLEAAVACYRRHYLERAGRTNLLPGAAEALATVETAGYEPAIVTAKHPIPANACLEATGLAVDRRYCEVHGAEKSAVLRELCATFYVGDTPDDMEAARGAGVFAVGVATGSFSSQALSAAGADVLLDDLTAFAPWFTATHGA